MGSAKVGYQGEGGLDALNDPQLGDAVAGKDGVGDGCEIGEDYFDLAAVAGIDDAGQGGEASQCHAGPVFDEGTEVRGKAERDAGGDGDGFAGLEGPDGDGVEVGGEVAEGSGVGVAWKLRVGVKLLDFHYKLDLRLHGSSLPPGLPPQWESER